MMGWGRRILTCCRLTGLTLLTFIFSKTKRMIITGFKIEKKRVSHNTEYECGCFWRDMALVCLTSEFQLWLVLNVWSECHYHLLDFCSSALTMGGEGRGIFLILSRLRLSSLIRLVMSPCSSSMDFLAGRMRDSATECLRSVISLFSLSREETRLRALEDCNM